MTYNKRLKTLKVYLMLDSEPITIADTADDDKATRALNEFKKYGSMHYETEEGGEKVTNEIPYHAVQYIEVTEADASVTKPDPYGCDEGGGGDTVTYIFHTDCPNTPPNSGTPDPIVTKKGETVTLPTIRTTGDEPRLWSVGCYETMFGFSEGDSFVVEAESGTYDFYFRYPTA